MQKTKGRGGDRNAESVLTRSSAHEKAEEKMQKKKKHKTKNKKLQAHRKGLAEFGKGLAGKACRMKTCFLHRDDSVFAGSQQLTAHNDFHAAGTLQEKLDVHVDVHTPCTLHNQPIFFVLVFLLSSFTCSFPASSLTSTRLKSLFACKLTFCTQRLCVQTRTPDPSNPTDPPGHFE